MTGLNPLTDDRQRPTMVRFLVLAWLCGLAALSYVHRNCLSVPAQLVQEDLTLSDHEMGQIMAAFFLGYAIFQIPSGWIADRWGTRIVLTVLIILWSAATGWLGLASGFLGMWLGRVAGGFAQAGIFPCSVNTISRWFPDTGKAFPSGMLGAFMSVGSVLSTALTAFLLYFMHWQQAIIVLTVPGFFCAVLFYLWFRDRPAEHSWVNERELALIQSPSPQKSDSAASATSSKFPLLTMLLSVQMWLLSSQQFFRAAAYIFFTTWFPSFLQKTRGVDISGSGFLASLPMLGVVVGSMSSGILMDWIYRATGSRNLSRKGIAVAALTVSGGLVLIAYHTHDPLLLTVILTLGSMCGGMAGPAAYTATIDMGGRHIATVFSTMNMGGNIGATIMPVAVVWLVQWRGWDEAILLVAGMYFAAAGCWLLLRVEGSIFDKPKRKTRDFDDSADDEDDFFFRERQK